MAADEVSSDEGSNSPSLTFDNELLSISDGPDAKHVDLNYFAHKGGMQPGQYRVQVKINGNIADERTLTFRSLPEKAGKLYACITPAQLTSWGVKVEAALAPDEDCPVRGVRAMVPFATEHFDLDKASLLLTVPQAALLPPSHLRTPSTMWDGGVSAWLMNYTYNRAQQSRAATTDFLALSSQLNIMDWRLRSDTNAYRRSDAATEFNVQNLYAQRDYTFWRGGQFTAGETTSDGSVMDSISFTGLKMASDEGMLNPELTRYTPAITGIAQSPATVTVRQNGRVVYQQSVPQGPFSLNDFTRTGSGDADVEVREVDGSVRNFTLSSAATPSLMRQGNLSYGLALGRFNDGNGFLSPEFAQASASYGLWANTTVFGGAQLSKAYQAATLGGGFYSSVLGALSYTLTGAKTQRPAPIDVEESAGISVGKESDEKVAVVGVAHEAAWSRSLGEFSVVLSATRYGSANFYTFSRAQSLTSGNEALMDAPRTRYQASLSRSLGEWGNLSLNGSRTDYFGTQNSQDNVTLSYNTTLCDVGLGLSVGVNTLSSTTGVGPGGASGAVRETTLALNASVPLGKWLSFGRVQGNYSYSRIGGRTNQQAGLSGGLRDGNLSYSISQGVTQSNGSLGVGYSGLYGVANSSYSYGGGTRTWSVGGSGGVVVHGAGVTLSRSLSLDGGNAVVAFPGVSGVAVSNVTTDWRGYAIVPGLTPYQRNTINVDVSQLPGNVEIDSTNKSVVPSRGALVKLDFAANTGYRVLLTLSRTDGHEVPFGAVATLKDATSTAPRTGIVGDEGRVYLSGLPVSGKVGVTWGEGPGEQCQVDYALPTKGDMQVLHPLMAVCR